MMVHESCIHPWEDEHLRKLHEPCEWKPYPIVDRGNSTGAGGNKGYYSGWSEYAQTVHKAGFGNLSSAWKVPAKPTSRGPAPPLISSSIYLFNGLEVCQQTVSISLQTPCDPLRHNRCVLFAPHLGRRRRPGRILSHPPARASVRQVRMHPQPDHVRGLVHDLVPRHGQWPCLLW